MQTQRSGVDIEKKGNRKRLRILFLYLRKLLLHSPLLLVLPQVRNPPERRRVHGAVRADLLRAFFEAGDVFGVEFDVCEER
jgi:hypothetical protein